MIKNVFGGYFISETSLVVSETGLLVKLVWWLFYSFFIFLDL
jgi:hypothetical protein